MENNNVSLEFFNLQHEGDNANVKVLYTSASKFTILDTHSIPNGERKKRIKCLGADKCPVCKDGRYPVEKRLYLHIYDMTDGKEKLWDRTANEKFLQLFTDIENNWGDLKTPAFNIKRDKDEFPTYTVSAFPNKSGVNVADDRYDIDVSYRSGIYRSAEELEQALATGIVPPHTKKQVDANANTNTARNTVSPSPVAPTVNKAYTPVAQNTANQFTPAPAPAPTPQPVYEEIADDDLPF